MGEAGKRKEMVEDRYVQEMHLEVRCRKEFRVKVLLVTEVCVKGVVCQSGGCERVECKKAVGERVTWDRSGRKSVVCPSMHGEVYVKELCVKELCGTELRTYCMSKCCVYKWSVIMLCSHNWLTNTTSRGEPQLLVLAACATWPSSLFRTS